MPLRSAGVVKGGHAHPGGLLRALLLLLERQLLLLPRNQPLLRGREGRRPELVRGGLLRPLLCAALLLPLLPTPAINILNLIPSFPSAPQ